MELRLDEPRELLICAERADEPWLSNALRDALDDALPNEPASRVLAPAAP